jgi:S1-C subfamily serine protease
MRLYDHHETNFDQFVPMTSFPLLPSENLVYTTARIECTLADGTSVGTGFFFADERGRRFLVTNRHVVEGAVGVLLAVTSAVATSSAPAIVTQVYFDYVASEWHVHPDDTVDLCAVSMDVVEIHLAAAGRTAFLTTISVADVPTDADLEDFQAIESVVMIGYPDGIWDHTNNQPVTRRGITATHPHRSYGGRAEFMLDIGCFSGSSGSPVFLYDTIGAMKRNGSVSMRPRRPIFLGVLFEGFMASTEGCIVKMGKGKRSVPMTDIPLNLGLALKACEVVSLTTSIS